jgi:hypothetical protein
MGEEEAGMAEAEEVAEGAEALKCAEAAAEAAGSTGALHTLKQMALELKAYLEGRCTSAWR